MFISSYNTISFFIKKFIFSNVYISVNTIFKCLYMIFWLRKGTSIKYVRNWQLVEDGKVTQNVDNFVQGQGLSCLMCFISLFKFLAAFLSYSVLFCL